MQTNCIFGDLNMAKTAIQYTKKKFNEATLIDLYKSLLKPRLIEEKMLSLLRQGKISKWFSGIGQEAISVGCTMALEKDEMIFPMHRNLGVFTSREVPLERLFCQWQGKIEGFTKGRDRSFHFGTKEFNIVGMISHLGPQLALAGGVALAHKLKKEKKVALAFTGEGGTSEGDFHEALNVASVWQLPVIFVIENNGYGLSTPTSEQYNCIDLADRGMGYGMRSYVLDGNNILEVYDTIKTLAAEIRKKPEPILIECKTFRMRGHEEASGTKYVPKKLMDAWAKKDPIANFEKFLLKQKLISKSDISNWTAVIKEEIKAALAYAAEIPKRKSTVEEELADVFTPYTAKSTAVQNHSNSEKRYIDAISDGLRAAMTEHDNLVLMGQDIAEYGGVFKITDGFVKDFGRDRVRNTPLCESAIIGVALGLSLRGFKSMVEMQFADFVTCGFNQIVNNLAKVHYRWGHAADVVIRMPAGGGVAAGPFHSQTNEMWFVHTPGLKVVFPSNPYDAKGLLLAAINDPNPVMFFEHKALYRTLSEEIPDGYYEIELGKAKQVKQGSDFSIITYGQAVHWAVDYCEENQLSADILDLRSLVPLDLEAIETTVKKTNRVIILHEDVRTGGLGADIAAHISEHCFEYLDAPVIRVTNLDTAVPFGQELEKIFLAKERLSSAVDKILEY